MKEDRDDNREIRNTTPVVCDQQQTEHVSSTDDDGVAVSPSGLHITAPKPSRETNKFDGNSLDERQLLLRLINNRPAALLTSDGWHFGIVRKVNARSVHIEMRSKASTKGSIVEALARPFNEIHPHPSVIYHKVHRLERLPEPGTSWPDNTIITPYQVRRPTESRKIMAREIVQQERRQDEEL